MTASALSFPRNPAPADVENQQTAIQYNRTATGAKLLAIAAGGALVTTAAVAGLANGLFTQHSAELNAPGRELLSSHCDPKGVTISKYVLIGSGVATGVGLISGCALSGDSICDSYSLSELLGNLSRALTGTGVCGLLGAGIAFGVLKNRC